MAHTRKATTHITTTNGDDDTYVFLNAAARAGVNALVRIAHDIVLVGDVLKVTTTTTNTSTMTHPARRLRGDGRGPMTSRGVIGRTVGRDRVIA